MGPLKLPSGEIVKDPLQMSEVFIEAFVTVFVDEIPANPTLSQPVNTRMKGCCFSLELVRMALEALNPHTSMGPDNIHPMLLKSCASSLAYPLYIIFHRSLHTGELPSDWKNSIVIPIFKSETRYNPLNYRPVSLTSVCCKTMERILADQLTEYLEANTLLSNMQFGFRKGRSTEDQLLLTYDSISRLVDVGEMVDLVLLDFSKAFDVVCHSILVRQLVSLGVDRRLVDWICSFLGGRTMRVLCGSAQSSSRRVCSGVPQGSVLGPLLFIVYVNSLPNGIAARSMAFADDFKLFLHCNRDNSDSFLNLMVRMQKDIDTIRMTSLSWNLKLNPSKCKVMRFCRGSALVRGGFRYNLGGVPLDFVDEYKDLGVLVDVKLRFHSHIQSVARKAAGMANNLLRSTVNRDADFMMTLFISHIRPIMDYCSCLWSVGYLGDSRLLESVQRRWTKQIRGFEDMNYGMRLRALNLFSMRGRRLRADLIKCWKAFHCTQDVGLSSMFMLAPRVGTRGHSFKLAVPSSFSDLRRRFYSVRVVSLWNNLPSRVAESCSLGAFKSGLWDSLGEYLFLYD